MNIGSANIRIDLEMPTQIPDGMGGFTVTFVKQATVWAKKTTHRSDEAVQTLMTTGTAIHNFRIRRRSDVKSSWRIKDHNTYMNILGPPVIVDKSWLDITAKQVS
jgi:SPP1 family predicted phage head-tail adaptor